MKRMMIVFLFIFIGLQLQKINVKAEDEQIQEKIERIKKAKDKNEKNKYMKEILSKKLQTSEDVEDIVKLSKVLKGREDKLRIIRKLGSIKEDDKHLEDEYIKLLDDKDEDVRAGAIGGLGILKCKKVAPKLREKVKDFGKIKYIEYMAKMKIDPEKGLDVVRETAVSMETLGELKDEEAIPILAEKMDMLGEFAGSALSKIGKKALPTILELAKKEIGHENRYYAKWALAGIRDTEAKPDLINILKTENDVDIKLRVLSSLNSMMDDETLKIIEDLYEQKSDSVLLSGLEIKKAIPFLIKVLKNDPDSSNRWYVAVKLGKLNDYSAVPALEEALNDRDREVRYRAAKALEKITGKEYEWKKQK